MRSVTEMVNFTFPWKDKLVISNRHVDNTQQSFNRENRICVNNKWDHPVKISGRRIMG